MEQPEPDQPSQTDTYHSEKAPVTGAFRGLCHVLIAFSWYLCISFSAVSDYFQLN